MGSYKAKPLHYLLVLFPILFVKIQGLLVNDSVTVRSQESVALAVSLISFAVGVIFHKSVGNRKILLLTMVSLFGLAFVSAELLIPPMTYKEWVKTEPFVEKVSANSDKWRLLNLNGKVVNNEQFTKKVILLNFTFSGCGPCLQKHPSLEWLNERIDKEEIAIYEIDLGLFDTLEEAKAFSDRSDGNLNWLYDPDNELAKSFHFRGAPYQVIIDKTGNLIEISRGFGITVANLYEKRTLEKLNELSQRTN
jgi:thiol-disulfide isomerase/thioredoxin